MFNFCFLNRNFKLDLHIENFAVILLVGVNYLLDVIIAAEIIMIQSFNSNQTVLIDSNIC